MACTELFEVFILLRDRDRCNFALGSIGLGVGQCKCTIILYI